MKGDNDEFECEGRSGHNGGDEGRIYVNGRDYNSAGSSLVGKVDSITTVANVHFMPTSSNPNSVTRNYNNGKLSTERYFGDDGKPYLDIDYSNHGNAKMHPNVPHEHIITYKDGKMNRKKGDGRIK